MSTETVELVTIKANQVKAGMTVIVDGDTTGEWTVLSHHPLNATWWLHRWHKDDAGRDARHQTTHAHYKNFRQVIR